MKFGPLLLTCINALIRNPMRAMLTVLGIVIGIAAVVAIMEIGNGSKKQIADQMAGLGADVINVFSASTRTAGVSGGMNTRASIYAEDADAIVKECGDTVETATPVVRANAQVIVGNKNWSPNSIVGGNENYLDIEGWEVDSGSPFTKEHVTNSSRVCLIGSTIARELFEGEDPIGKDIRIKDVMFTVIGVLATKGADMGGNDKDDCIILPWSSVRTRLKGASNEATITAGGAANRSSVSSTDTFSTSAVDFYPGSDLQPFTNAPHPLRTLTVDFISVKVKDVTTISQTMDDMAAVLRRQHRLEPGVLDDFTLRDRAQFTKMVTSTADTMSTLLIAVAMISLVVGGVGIMNIMMVSVTERTKEIGLRMAVGARPVDIMWQFLLEAVLLCITGGILGIALGRTISLVVAAKTGLPVESSPTAMLLAVSVSAIIGIIFGWYPAYKGSKLDPIDALHHE
ncbi:MAG TPA: ABC transporter permease [Candidatus Akkermansia intestinigallinarum]|uniref:ABC transporter permease n=1 Tax=Candidatus Akkermansia intestinigallinarum TaxID=2838431 RepID=A0A9D1VCA5_9BACT|nr:ABC transporter permease [Candidatus Akkermansia intestinigallinarum]